MIDIITVLPQRKSMSAELQNLLNLVVDTPEGKERIVLAAWLHEGEIQVIHVDQKTGDLKQAKITDLKMTIPPVEQTASPDYPSTPKGPAAA